MKKTVIVTGMCALIAFMVFLQCNNAAQHDPRGALYAGAAACAQCHSHLYQSWQHTAHYMASLPANEKTVHGSFADPSNSFIVNDRQKMVMEKQGGNLYQTYYLNNKVKERYRFDIVFGAVKGESYLSWKDDELFQLPLSYYDGQHQWSTSPGYGFDFLDYPVLRSIGKPCMECHASYIDNLPGQAQQLNKQEKFDKATLVYGIDCERCHGPAAAHVNFQLQHPGSKTAGYIAKYSSLSRSQKLDMCAVCHSGKPGMALRSVFEFVPGDTLARFRLPGFSAAVDAANLDVHGNQLQLLQSSKCYMNSNMDCASCHDTHINTRGNTAMYTQKCFSCHNTTGHTYCKMTGKITTATMQANCIGCHMPALPAKTIAVQVGASLPAVQFFVHTHHIGIYPGETKRVMDTAN